MILLNNESEADFRQLCPACLCLSLPAETRLALLSDCRRALRHVEAWLALALVLEQQTIGESLRDPLQDRPWRSPAHARCRARLHPSGQSRVRHQRHVVRRSPPAAIVAMPPQPPAAVRATPWRDSCLAGSGCPLHPRHRTARTTRRAPAPRNRPADPRSHAGCAAACGQSTHPMRNCQRGKR